MSEIRRKLAELAQRERNSSVLAGRAGETGKIDNREPAAIQATRRALRRMHYSFTTERACVGWIERFLAAHPAVVA